MQIRAIPDVSALGLSSSYLLTTLIYNTSDTYSFTYREFGQLKVVELSFNSLSNTKPSVHPYKFFTLFQTTILRQKLKLKSKERTENFIQTIPKKKNDVIYPTRLSLQNKPEPHVASTIICSTMGVTRPWRAVRTVKKL